MTADRDIVAPGKRNRYTEYSGAIFPVQ
jgi:hypothetical protein